MQAGTGLLTLAAAVRGGVPGPRVILEHAQPLACGVELVQGVRSAAQAQGLGRLWSTLAEACRASEVDVIADLGRFQRTSPVLPLAQSADAFIPVAAASLESVMHLADGLTEVMPALVRYHAPRVCPVLVGPDAHAEGDCADLDDLLRRSGHLTEPTLPIAYDPKALIRLERGETPASRLRRTLLLRRARTMAAIVGPALTEPDQTGAEPTGAAADAAARSVPDGAGETTGLPARVRGSGW